MCPASMTLVLPSAARPAMTIAAPPLKSVAVTVAPLRLRTPQTHASLPSTAISAPKRMSWAAWQKRLSKIFSVNLDIP